MNTAENITQSLRELGKKKDFERITVGQICERANISRKTFYQYFRDKNDVIEKIILSHVTIPLGELSKLHTLHELPPTFVLDWRYQQFYEDRAFYRRISNYIGQNSFQEFILQHTSDLIGEKLVNVALTDEEKEYTIYFYSASYTMLLVKWIKDGMKISPKIMASFYEKWTVPLWLNIK